MGTMAPPSLTPGPRGNGSEAPGGLTPAARRLLTKTTLGSAAARRAEVMERNSAWDRSSSAAGSRERELNKVRWTPTPSPVTRRGL
jgi:protein DGCR14